MTTIALIVPVYLNFEGYTKLMHSITEPVVPIVVDNYSNNRGVAGGWNHGIKKAMNLGYDKYLVCNDDITFVEGRPSLFLEDLKTNELVLSEMGFACFGITKQAIETVGYFDENFWPAYFEDNDFHLRFKKENLSETWNTQVKLEHKKSSTQFFHGEAKRVVTHEMFRNNEAYFKAKWGNDRDTGDYYETPFNGVSLDKFKHLINKKET